MVVKNSIKFNSQSERKSLEETKVPPIFGLPPDALDDKKPTSDFAVPIIDFAGVHKSREAVHGNMLTETNDERDLQEVSDRSPDQR